ncbi:MAG: YqzE family protein [Firmicutes bacterium]|uniref:YqzE-like protein n=1 Tax=Melghirimyces thermohalophilus TaxID=1236220 RepID=A0A1G6HQ56_9BACL|nr:YqzE family protein [Melghirimyces thermohalophilus]MDA8351972.1 YqzE family protein [Bacillota bacterium]SDB95626.1 YqzE-like protein [Melghirimyces thermohalophilus]
MSTQDFLKYLVQEMVKYMDTPRDRRREERISRKQQRPSWGVRWFGMVPFGMKMFTHKQRSRLRGGNTR